MKPLLKIIITSMQHEKQNYDVIDLISIQNTLINTDIGNDMLVDQVSVIANQASCCDQILEMRQKLQYASQLISSTSSQNNKLMWFKQSALTQFLSRPDFQIFIKKSQALEGHGVRLDKYRFTVAPNLRRQQFQRCVYTNEVQANLGSQLSAQPLIRTSGTLFVPFKPSNETQSAMTFTSLLISETAMHTSSMFAHEQWRRQVAKGLAELCAAVVDDKRKSRLIATMPQPAPSAVALRHVFDHVATQIETALAVRMQVGQKDQVTESFIKLLRQIETSEELEILQSQILRPGAIKVVKSQALEDYKIIYSALPHSSSSLKFRRLFGDETPLLKASVVYALQAFIYLKKVVHLTIPLQPLRAVALFVTSLAQLQKQRLGKIEHSFIILVEQQNLSEASLQLTSYLNQTGYVLAVWTQNKLIESSNYLNTQKHEMYQFSTASDAVKFNFHGELETLHQNQTFDHFVRICILPLETVVNDAQFLSQHTSVFLNRHKLQQFDVALCTNPSRFRPFAIQAQQYLIIEQNFKTNNIRLSQLATQTLNRLQLSEDLEDAAKAYIDSISYHPVQDVLKLSLPQLEFETFTIRLQRSEAIARRATQCFREMHNYITGDLDADISSKNCQIEVKQYCERMLTLLNKQPTQKIQQQHVSCSLLMSTQDYCVRYLQNRFAKIIKPPKANYTRDFGTAFETRIVKKLARGKRNTVKFLQSTQDLFTIHRYNNRHNWSPLKSLPDIMLFPDQSKINPVNIQQFVNSIKFNDDQNDSNHGKGDANATELPRILQLLSANDRQKKVDQARSADNKNKLLRILKRRLIVHVCAGATTLTCFSAWRLLQQLLDDIYYEKIRVDYNTMQATFERFQFTEFNMLLMPDVEYDHSSHFLSLSASQSTPVSQKYRQKVKHVHRDPTYTMFGVKLLSQQLPRTKLQMSTYLLDVYNTPQARHVCRITQSSKAKRIHLMAPTRLEVVPLLTLLKALYSGTQQNVQASELCETQADVVIALVNEQAAIQQLFTQQFKLLKQKIFVLRLSIPKVQPLEPRDTIAQKCAEVCLTYGSAQIKNLLKKTVAQSRQLSALSQRVFGHETGLSARLLRRVFEAQFELQSARNTIVSYSELVNVQQCYQFNYVQNAPGNATGFLFMTDAAKALKDREAMLKALAAKSAPKTLQQQFQQMNQMKLVPAASTSIQLTKQELTFNYVRQKLDFLAYTRAGQVHAPLMIPLTQRHRRFIPRCCQHEPILNYLLMQLQQCAKVMPNYAKVAVSAPANTFLQQMQFLMVTMWLYQGDLRQEVHSSVRQFNYFAQVTKSRQLREGSHDPKTYSYAVRMWHSQQQIFAEKQDAIGVPWKFVNTVFWEVAEEIIQQMIAEMDDDKAKGQKDDKPGVRYQTTNNEE